MMIPHYFPSNRTISSFNNIVSMSTENCSTNEVQSESGGG